MCASAILYFTVLSIVVLSDSAFFTITIVAKAIYAIFDSITIVHFSLIILMKYNSILRSMCRKTAAFTVL